MIEELKNKIFSGEMITKDEAMSLIDAPLDELCKAADEIREKFCDNVFDICTIINAKSGRCSEDCKYCSQSAFHCTNVEEYPLLDKETVVNAAKKSADKGIKRFSLVASGKRLSDSEVDKVCEIIKEIRKISDISVCASLGLLNEEQFKRLKDAGLTRVHNNLESSRNYFPNVCTTHTYDDKINAIKAAKKAGLSVCSGGIAGLGESMEDRIDMAFEVRNLGVSSMPVNMLNPIKGTPYENNKKLTKDDMRRICAIFRFINPSAAIRLAGGRILLDDGGKSCFESGANAAISGDMLTTTGETVMSDMQLIKSLGFTAGLLDEIK